MCSIDIKDNQFKLLSLEIMEGSKRSGDIAARNGDLMLAAQCCILDLHGTRLLKNQRIHLMQHELPHTKTSIHVYTQPQNLIIDVIVIKELHEKRYFSYIIRTIC